MKVLVDSSVWIDLFNGRDSLQVAELERAVHRGIVVVGDLSVLEVLQGFRSDVDFHAARQRFAAFPTLPLLAPERVLAAASAYRRLRSRGITIRKTADLIIGSYCISEGLPLLFSDRDFEPMVEHLGLIRFRA